MSSKKFNCQKFCFYEKPINISINQAKNKIYTIQQSMSLISEFNLDEYSITVDGKVIKDKQLTYDKIINIKIDKLIILDNNSIDKYIKREKPILPLKKSTLEIYKNYLSLYFNEICIPYDKEEEKVSLILNQNRIQFIGKINDFISSKYKFF